MMIYLARHGEPKEEQEDPDRPLTERGWRDIRRVAAALKAAGVGVEAIYHSPKTRAAQTAQGLGDSLQPKRGVSEAKGLKPLDDPSIWAYQLSQAKEEILLVGHLPHMVRLASLLLVGDSEALDIDLKAGAVLCLERNESSGWALCWMVDPNILS